MTNPDHPKLDDVVTLNIAMCPIGRVIRIDGGRVTVQWGGDPDNRSVHPAAHLRVTGLGDVPRSRIHRD